MTQSRMTPLLAPVSLLACRAAGELEQQAGLTADAVATVTGGWRAGGRMADRVWEREWELIRTRAQAVKAYADQLLLLCDRAYLEGAPLPAPGEEEA